MPQAVYVYGTLSADLEGRRGSATRSQVVGYDCKPEDSKATFDMFKR